MTNNSAIILLEQAAQRWGSRIALDDTQRQCTYAQYRQWARQIATGLLGSGAPVPTVLYLPKSIEALAAMMGCMYAGSPYVPVAENIPLTRLEKILDSLRPCRIVTSASLAQKLELDVPVLTVESLLEAPVDEEAIARALNGVVDSDPIYIMFTSGSTGVPKGVTIPHRGILDYAHWVVGTFGFDENTVMASQAPLYFDNSTFDIYGTLRCGGKLVLTPDILYLYPLKLPQFLQENHITSIFWVPTVMINVANSGALDAVELPELKNVAFCGEVMPNKQLNIWRRRVPHASYANLYGPTEITDVCCYYQVREAFADSDPLPIGRACENMRVHILTEDGREAQAGETGELCVVGSGVALGYWRAPELTGKAFVRNPLRSDVPEIMYRTGDLAYRREDGVIMFLGRRDNQIKLKGNRIELGEIETAAVCIPGVENAAALFHREKEEIVLFVEGSCKLPLRKFNMELKKYIPPYMLPARLVVMDRLPHTANDKIDRICLRGILEERNDKSCLLRN